MLHYKASIKPADRAICGTSATLWGKINGVTFTSHFQAEFYNWNRSGNVCGGGGTGGHLLAGCSVHHTRQTCLPHPRGHPVQLAGMEIVGTLLILHQLPVAMGSLLHCLLVIVSSV